MQFVARAFSGGRSGRFDPCCARCRSPFRPNRTRRTRTRSRLAAVSWSWSTAPGCRHTCGRGAGTVSPGSRNRSRERFTTGWPVAPGRCERRSPRRSPWWRTRTPRRATWPAAPRARPSLRGDWARVSWSTWCSATPRLSWWTVVAGRSRSPTAVFRRSWRWLPHPMRRARHSLPGGVQRLRPVATGLVASGASTPIPPRLLMPCAARY